jgi:hypothetical protein
MRSSTPDDPFLIEEVIDDFDAVAHLNLGFFGHWENGTDQFSGFDIVKRGNSITSTLFKFLPVTCHGCLLFL